MASLAQDSIATVSSQELREAKEQLLNGDNAPQNQPYHTADAQESYQHTEEQSESSSDDRNDASVDKPSTIPESYEPNRTPDTSPLNKPPARLSASKSAGPKMMEAMVQSSPSQDRYGGLQKAQSFHGIPGGDTQEFPSQLYLESISRPNETEEQGEALNENDEGDIHRPKESDEPGQARNEGDEQDQTLDEGDGQGQTLNENDPGFINLAGDWQEEQTSPARSPPEYTEEFLQDLESQTPAAETQFRVPDKPLPEPETPAHPQRHDSNSDLPTSVPTTRQTPNYSQIFGGRPALMGNSQLFEQTQQPSSPAVDALRSDPVDNRPSPNANYGETSSSPAGHFLSSPDLGRNTRPFSAAGEPKSHYFSIKESQERRARKRAELREQFERQQAAESEDDDDVFDNEYYRKMGDRKLRRALSDQAMHEQEKISAPIRPGSRQSSIKKGRQTVVDLTTPATVSRGTRVQFDNFDDEASDEDVNDQDNEPEEPRHDEEFERPDGASVDDEYDELGQDVLKSQPNEPDESDHESVADSVEQNDVEMVDEERDDQANQDRDEKPHNRQQPEQNTQRSTIVDSQRSAQPNQSQVTTVQQVQQSSTTSFVPGSQHVGKTSEDQVLLAASQRKSQTRVAASPVQREDSGTDKVPSSPPLAVVSSTLPEGSAEVSLVRQEILADFQAHKSATQTGSAPAEEIPESDLPDAETIKPEAMEEDMDQDEETQETNDVAPFSTARSHVSGSVQSPARRSLAPSAVPSPHKPTQSQRSRLSEPSPRKLAGVRRFAEFATNPMATNASFELVADVDDVMQGVITEEDREVWDKTSDSFEATRASKRRKTSHKGSSRQASSNSGRSLARHHSDVEPQMGQQPTSEANGTIAESEQEILRPDSPPQALRDSPNKANKMPAPALPDGMKPEPEEPLSTESARMREHAGSDAVSQLIHARGDGQAKKTKQTTYGRASRRKSSRADMKAAKSKAKVEVPVEEDDEAEPDEMQTADMEVDETAVDFDSAMEVEPIEPAAVDDQPLATDIPEDETTSEQQNDADLVPAPNRVIALFRGTQNGFFPATWLGGSPDGATFKVRFDDRTETNIEAFHVRSLDLRVDDYVKVDVAGLRNKIWRIAGFGAPAQNREERGYDTDVYGHIRVQVQPKSRDSMPKDGATDGETGETREVFVSQLYLTHTMWPHFSEREFSIPSSKVKPERSETPSTRSATPSTETPASRSRRAIVPTAKAKSSGLRTSHLRETSVASSSRSASSNAIFSGMAFAISYVSNETEKAEVTRKIQRNGGIVLDAGFEELFELPNIGEVASTSPKRKSPKKQAQQETTGLHLKGEYKDLGFVALIADKHSRRAKYMQALALGLPTVSGRWITDSLDGNKNDTMSNGSVTPLPWDRYLLPAGESAYLGGAIRSRTIAPYDTDSADVTATISARPVLLDGENVLIVAPKKGKAGWEKRKTYAFLTLALGAGKVQRVGDLQEAKALMEEHPDTPKWVYVDGSVAEAETNLFEKNAGGKKRKRGAETPANKSSATHGNVRIVDDEFVVQSLILGALYD